MTMKKFPSKPPRPTDGKVSAPKKSPPVSHKDQPSGGEQEDMRLNKYLALSGVGSRRKCAEYIQEGLVKVNGAVVTDIGHRVQKSDQVHYKGQPVKPVTRMVYYLMNKPKDTITTASDEKGRKTVMDLIKNKVKERVYPVGRLDRNTTGLLILTNDGDLALKLSHPRHRVKKIYHVVLDRTLRKPDLEKILAGVQLEDGLAEVDGIDYVENQPKNEVGITIHIGKNRIVRRIFESLGYQVERLDRVYYAGLTKKDLPRGFVRPLTKQEVIMLKHFT